MTVASNLNPNAVGEQRVLMIAAAFPPTGGPGVQRSAKLAKYLPRFGWSPIVWAADRIESLPADETLLEDLPAEVEVHRRPSMGRARTIQRRVRDAMSRGVFTDRVAGAIDWRLEKWIQDRSWPDEFALWARSSLPALRVLVEEQGIKAIYSTHSPISNHWLGLQLRRATGMPWIADFRDLWVDDYRYVESSPKRLKADARLQHDILREADAIVSVTDGQSSVLAGHIPDRHHKFHTIMNGFDPADFASVERGPRIKTERFVMAHVGRLDRRCARPEWMAGLKRFVDRIGREKETFLFKIVGHADNHTLERLREAGIPFTFTGYVSHAQAISEMCDADVLMLLMPEGRHASTVHCAKLFEYLAAHRPIFAVGPHDSEVKGVVQSCHAGLFTSFDAASIADRLYEMFKSLAGDQVVWGCSDEQLDTFSRVRTAERFSGLLNGLVAAVSPPGIRSMAAVEVPTL